MGVAGDARASVVSRRHMEAGSWRLVLAGRLLPYALIGPALLVIIGVLGYPLGTLLWLSTQHYGLRELLQHQGVFVGLKNFQAFSIDPQFRYVVQVSELRIDAEGLEVDRKSTASELQSRLHLVCRLLLEK